MASLKTCFELLTLLCLLILSPAEPKRGHANLLSLLSNKLHHNRQPVIILVDKDTGFKEDRVIAEASLSSETSGEAAHLTHHLLGHEQIKKKTLQHKRSTLKPGYERDEKKRQRFRAQRIREERNILQREDKNVLRSPIVKKLLRISNSLRCEAKDECQDKCNIKFEAVITVKKCVVQCEIKYDCEEEQEEKDPCEEDTDSCGKSDEVGSTRGVTSVTDDPGCKRC